MSWRERARVREHREPPIPPRQAFIVLDERQDKQLQRAAKARNQEVDQLLADLTIRFLAREDRNRRRRRQEASTNGNQG